MAENRGGHAESKGHHAYHRARPATHNQPEATGPKDAHRLAGHQFDYCRELARLGGFFTPGLDARLCLVEHVYKVVTATRPKVVGAADDYRQVQYTLDGDSAFTVQRPGEPAVRHTVA